jgi:histidinol-phosphatase
VGYGDILTKMDELDLARELADIAAEIAMRYFRPGIETATKDDGTLVTIADREIEELLRRRIQQVFPDHGVLGEEAGLQGDKDGPIWVLDPIDGTNNYAWGIPIFATLIALRVEGRTEVGIASAPAINERYEGARQNGARMNGIPIQVTDIETIEEARIVYGSHRGIVQHGLGDRWADILQRCRRERGFGDFWGHMLVARGAAEVMLEPSLAIWDVAALEVIVEEAGGRIGLFSGEPYPNSRMWSNSGPSSCLTTNGRLHGKLVSALSS